MKEKLDELALICVKEGKILGLKEAQKALDGFINQKVGRGYPASITRKELKVFMDEYIRLAESENSKLNNGD